MVTLQYENKVTAQNTQSTHSHLTHNGSDAHTNGIVHIHSISMAGLSFPIGINTKKPIAETISPNTNKTRSSIL